PPSLHDALPISAPSAGRSIAATRRNWPHPRRCSPRCWISSPATPAPFSDAFIAWPLPANLKELSHVQENPDRQRPAGPVQPIRLGRRQGALAQRLAASAP